jgi:hypothetical protein
MNRTQERSLITEDVRPALRPDRAWEYDLVPVDVRLHGVSEIPLVPDNAADQQSSCAAAGDLDGVGSSLVRMDATTRDKLLAGSGAEREHLEVDAVMNGRGIVKPGVAVGIGDRDAGRDRR